MQHELLPVKPVLPKEQRLLDEHGDGRAVDRRVGVEELVRIDEGRRPVHAVSPEGLPAHS